MIKEKQQTIGQICRIHRRLEGIRLKDIAEQLGYSVETISAFERGRTDNYDILLAYIASGLSIEEVLTVWRA